MNKKILRITPIIIGVLLVGALSSCVYQRLPKFGALPKGERKERILASPNYRDNEFKNLDSIPEFTGSIIVGWTRMALKKKDNPRPKNPVPSVKTDLKDLDVDVDLVVWLGHSSYYFHKNGKRFLFDPVLSKRASPFPLVNRAFKGTNIYTVDDIPFIDYLLISHDHWDHLDYPTVKGLKDKIGFVVVPLGVGAHFERWGFAKEKIHELDWWDSVQINENVVLHALPALHYSGRSTKRNQTLWTSYGIISSALKLYFSGDSGYGTHLKMAGDTFGGFDIAFLDFGQYNEAWRWIHKLPEEIVLAANDLNATTIFPKHMGKFSQAYHSWDDPFIRTVEASEGQPYILIMPIPGEVISLDNPKQYISGWWKR